MSNSAVNTLSDPLSAALAWGRGGAQVALAWVTETWGSAPRAAGSLLAIREDGQFEGSVSGGCVEGAVIEAARSVLDSGEPRLLEFGVSNSAAWEVGLSCGGKIRVYVEPMNRDLLDRIAEDRAARRAVVVVTDLDSGRHWTVDPDAVGDDLPPGVVEAVRAAARDDKSGVADCAGTPYFLNVFNPALRLMIVGGVHIAQPLAMMAQTAGYEVTVIDPRTAFANAGRFPGVQLATEWPDEVLADAGLDRRTAVVTLTHDPKLDDAALMAALGSEVFYIGCLGSKKTHAARLERLSRQGVDEAVLARIHGPVGLDIGAKSPAEIAVAIMAEITAVLRGKAAS